LQAKDYANVKDPSLLRFLVDLRGEEVDNKQMRDDLITLLIAGHETTAAVLTWSVFALNQHPEELAKVQAEIDQIVGDRVPTIEEMGSLRLTQNLLAETLRMWPAPPLLLRCALEADTWPEGGTGVEGGVKIPRAGDVMISMYNMGRSPQLWENPDLFDPDRWQRPASNPEVKGWAGYDPKLRRGLYPSESATDFAFIPFGGGERKCVGDQFAMLEAMVTTVMLLRRFEFKLDMPANEVGMTAAATIHTRNGLWCTVTERDVAKGSASKEAPAAVAA
jgi:cytochrome P450